MYLQVSKFQHGGKILDKNKKTFIINYRSKKEVSSIKIDDIARLAGYSKSTVSKVINNYPGIPESTKEKIMKVIKNMNLNLIFKLEI